MTHRAVLTRPWMVKINRRPVYDFETFKEAYSFAKFWEGSLKYEPFK
jgi:hypothetical protein